MCTISCRLRNFILISSLIKNHEKCYTELWHFYYGRSYFRKMIKDIDVTNQGQEVLLSKDPILQGSLEAMLISSYLLA